MKDKLLQILKDQEATRKKNREVLEAKLEEQRQKELEKGRG